ncbi:peptide-methionine (S)-S-oxide reductase MsrA [Sphingomonas sp. PAMC 26605]|uniref:peptide-methionine (S)-S-oxide reductase MsrA n=1 Tax=Sphingomonas sp. PAMC 26605 TaxID=1112214 RepID=UPI00026CCB00|nr:peptide-methionine (S)-S-oxide reductase MsrA [Sphingomonas sp. PAMC 26605]
MFRTPPLIAVLFAGAAVTAASSQDRAEVAAKRVPAAVTREIPTANRETAIFAGGCFWGVEGVFRHVKGVVSATSGYTGGASATAGYELVSTGTTGHAESVKVVFDPRQVNYADLLRVYFSVVADPTEVNRQGPDEGTQYRTALFPLSPAQTKVARAYIAQLGAAHVYPRPIATRLERQQGFFAAEAYHQDFLARNPDYPYILINDRPKVEALKRLFPGSWKA